MKLSVCIGFAAFAGVVAVCTPAGAAPYSPLGQTVTDYAGPATTSYWGATNSYSQGDLVANDLTTSSPFEIKKAVGYISARLDWHNSETNY